MKSWKRLQTSMALLACCGMLTPTAVWAEQVTTATPRRAVETVDVELTAQGTLQGKLVDQSGAAIANAQVALGQSAQVVAKSATRVDGTFEFTAMRGGLYNVVADGTPINVRAWAPRTAPPLAHDGLLVVKGAILRGQSCTADSCTGTCGGSCDACGVAGGPLGLLMNPFVIGAAVAAAIAIPLALDDDDAS
ncbi:MAG: carboxypeptidase-like regulatory domain-containing protein [Planctomycetota bacterium]